MTTDHGLSEKHVATIRGILAPFADRITRVDLFGSRATGAHRPNSDVDLVLFGDVPRETVDRLWTLFHESSLPFSVDVQAYESIAYRPLKMHVDRVRKTLLTQADLKDALE